MTLEHLPTDDQPTEPTAADLEAAAEFEALCQAAWEAENGLTRTPADAEWWILDPTTRTFRPLTPEELAELAAELAGDDDEQAAYDAYLDTELEAYLERRAKLY